MTAKERATVCDSTRASYTHFTPVILRYGDTDRQGHVNNAVYCTFFESGRCAFLFEKNGETVAGADRNFVIAKLTLDYLQEMNYPGNADVGSKIISIGKSSFVVGQAVFVGDKCYSTAESIIVLIDKETKKSTAITEPFMSVLRDLMPQ